MKIFLFRTLVVLLLTANSAFADSIGWAAKEELPDWLSVELDIPRRWGSPLAFNLYSTVRVKLTNKRDSEIRLLNVRFSDPKFILVRKNGSTIPLPVSIKELRKPELNPGITIGARSDVGFEITMDRLTCPNILPEEEVAFEMVVAFVAGDVVERRESDGSINPNVGSLDGFDYTLARRLSGAKRLLK